MCQEKYYGLLCQIDRLFVIIIIRFSQVVIFLIEASFFCLKPNARIINFFHGYWDKGINCHLNIFLMFLQDIFIYPIKSLGGIRLEESVLKECGLEFDRQWMLVDEQGFFLSQRKFPKMALLQVDMNEEGLFVWDKRNPETNIQIPLISNKEEIKAVSIWDDQVDARFYSNEVGKWFSDFLGISCNLVSMFSERKIDPYYAANNESVSFSDGMPYLMIGQNSLEDLNSRLFSSVPMNRFRPNFVFAGGEPFVEDQWDKVQIGEAVFRITKPCGRCVVTTINQNTAEKGKEPLLTLSTFRTMDNLVLFGQNMMLEKGVKIKVGDEVFPV